MSSETRKYEQKARADSQRATRELIAKAAAELHVEKGVADTTVSEIARRAGVTRLTVYNHFADLSELIPACSTHYMGLHPEPDYESILATGSPDERVEKVLLARYRWFRETNQLLGNIYSDRHRLPELDEHMKEALDQPAEDLAVSLANGFPAENGRTNRLVALLLLSLDFWTWHRLDQQGLSDEDAADLMTSTVLP